VPLATPARAATSSTRVAAKPFSQNSSSAALRIAARRAADFSARNGWGRGAFAGRAPERSSRARAGRVGFWRRSPRLGEDEAEARPVGAKRVGDIARSGQTDITVRPDKVEGVPGDAGLAGGLAPGKPPQAQPGLRASLFDLDARIAINMRLPVEAAQAREIIRPIFLAYPG
jgi:hypothetical protein